MRRYVFDVSCPECGGVLHHVNGSCFAGTEATAISRCLRCEREWSVSVFLRPLPRDGNAARRKQAQRAKASV